jgi:thiamine-monophosphate kinase
MIDISDGLSTDLIHVIEESSCGATLRADAIPIAHCASELAPALGLDPLVLALHGGEEYELLFTASPEKVGRVMEVAASLQEPVSVIGEIRAGAGLFLELDGRTEPVERGGFEHRF